jgi:hypothetical protein
MKRRILPILVAGALMAVGATPALGNAVPGPNFPEQPGNTFPEQQPEPFAPCGALVSNSGSTTQFDNHAADIADNDITSPLLYDACFERSG